MNIVSEEMSRQAEKQLESYNNEELIIYNATYTNLYNKFPNEYYKYLVIRSYTHMISRGLDPENANLLQKTL